MLNKNQVGLKSFYFPELCRRLSDYMPSVGVGILEAVCMSQVPCTGSDRLDLICFLSQYPGRAVGQSLGYKL